MVRRGPTSIVASRVAVVVDDVVAVAVVDVVAKAAAAAATDAKVPRSECRETKTTSLVEMAQLPDDAFHPWCCAENGTFSWVRPCRE